MGQKKITELQLRSDVDDTCNFPIDDGIQTYRVTGLQILDYVFAVTRTITAGGNTLSDDDRTIFLNPTSASFTQALPACASSRVGYWFFKNIALPSNGNTVTLDANSTELIDDEETLVLNSYPSMDSVILFNTGTKWLRMG